MKISPLPEQVASDKDQWIEVGKKILTHYSCEPSAVGIGRSLDLWFSEQDVEEGEMIDGLGFLLGHLLIDKYSGRWIWVEDEFGQVPAVQRIEGGSVTYVLDVISKRLEEKRPGMEKELGSLADVYSES